ncbi:Ceramidase [Nitrosospira briensis]|uniref:Ceramidase n=2 Tax=Nitrosospira briensis TaxID=35799 RepID=A0A1I5EVT6_9PROT|nr:Ceramidase [Nitrosospira briensis]
MLYASSIDFTGLNMSDRHRLWMLSILSVGMLLLAALVPPIPQPVEYHQFADQRSYFDIPNFFNVVSNGAFLLVGMAGLGFLLHSRGAHAANAFVEPSERWPYLVLFLNVTMVCIGSAYYHLAPDNERLMWDRLPIAIGIMALLAATLSERVSPKVGLRLLPVLIAIGLGSVMHWHWSEQRGDGNLNFYIVAQFYSILLIILLAIYFRSRYARGADIYIALAIYAVAKLAEIADRAIYDFGQVISGHTVKHLLAAGAIYWVLRMLRKRTPLL